MEICTICNKTYKNISTLKTHYNSSAHKRQAELVAANTLNDQAPKPKKTTQQQGQATQQQAQATQQQAQATQQQAQATQQQQPISKEEIARIRAQKLKQVEEQIATNPVMRELLKTSNLAQHLEELPENDDENLTYSCMTCSDLFKNRHDLTLHQYNCPDFVLGNILSYTTGAHLGICLKTIFTQKFYNSTGQQRVAAKLKILELETLGGILDIDIQKRLSTQEQDEDNDDESNKPEFVLGPDEDGSWIYFNAMRPIHEENMIILRQQENIEKLLASGPDCFKTLVELVYSQPENKNMYFSELNGMISITVSVDGELQIIKTVEIIPVLIQKYIDFLINLFTTLGKPIQQIYDDLGLTVVINGTNNKLVNSRTGDYTKIMCDIIKSFKSQAIQNVNLFDKVKHRIIEVDRNLLNFCKYTIYHSNSIYTYKNAMQPQTTDTHLPSTAMTK